MSSKVWGIVALASVIIAGCGSVERPDAATWLTEWQTVVEAIPDQSDLPDESLCQSTLAQVRQRSEDLLPSPSIAVDELANEWVAIAETTFFECPPDEPEVRSFSDAYEDLERIEDSVKSALSEPG